MEEEKEDIRLQSTINQQTIKDIDLVVKLKGRIECQRQYLQPLWKDQLV